MVARITPQEMKAFFKGSKNWADTGNSEGSLVVSAGGAAAQGMVQDNYNLQALIEPDEKTELPKHDLALQPARTLKGHVIGPDGKPLAGAIAYGLESGWFMEQTLKTDAFTVTGLNPLRTRQLLFYHKEKNLGCFKEIRGDEPGPLKIQLQPCGSATGRLVDKDGQPLPGLRLHVYRFGLIGPGGTEANTDKDGRFRVEGLAPGQKYWLSLANPQARVNATFAVTPGEKKDLGDVTVE
jgi:hypothetical protein